MKDVAKEAGVGLGTVSRVINKNGPVKPSTRLKVEKAIETLNYKTNEVARNFKMQQTCSVALIVPTIWHPFFSKFAYHVETTLSENGYKMILCNSQSDVTNEINYIEMLEKNKIDGLIVITYSRDLDQYITSNLPIVSIDRHFTENVVYVTSDNEKGGRIAASELIKRNCKKIAYLGSVSDIKNESMKRRQGFEDEAKRQKISYHVLELNEPVDDIRKNVIQFLDEHADVDGIFAMNDKWAKIVMKTLQEKKLLIPDDVQVIGYDGITASKEEELTFSTIKQPVQMMAKKATEALINIINEQPTEDKLVLPVEFYEGTSTK
ncbi:LacI family transcriptional regulator [Jeotgalibacillus sp. S-D1]|uniref:LacI family DNA-binding transcriptional regulator n=1 Tax=Jeotgalibacillus sp. S-D1 TaxID=2552189 RepID=UPI00105A149E|nr:LacI family DNA-binding transcriptional regulator [Jeotgalibacillus sp. S-D1]TDL31950.1 LacI family transcriptional regulator [Jeotgalibacillus sp. S-D1]